MRSEPSSMAEPPSRRRAPLVGAAVVLAVAVGLGAYALTRESDEAPGPAAAAPSASPDRGNGDPSPTPPSTPSTGPASSAPTATSAPDKPVAVGRGRPTCNGRPCEVQHRLTRSFLPRYGGQQTLLLSKSDQADATGDFLHAFLVDDQGSVLWEEHGFGWEFQPVDKRFAIRFDDAGHVFFRAYAADSTFLYVLDVSGPAPRLLGASGRSGKEGFANAEIVETPGEERFAIRESTSDCAPDANTCETTQTLYRWNGRAYVPA